ncbi:MAG: arsenate reductase family protein [Oscillospiraceae bacterium]|nr:arsenate reductase family protein [Oscillospiraceae bacterium]
MAIQIFGKSKCFDTKKAERWFSERGIKVQNIDIISKGLSKGEFDSVVKAIGGVDNIIDTKAKDYCMIKYLLDDAKYDKLCECPKLYKTPIVRCGKDAAVGYNPEMWEKFIAEESRRV